MKDETITLTAEMIHSLGVSLSGMECYLTDGRKTTFYTEHGEQVWIGTDPGFTRPRILITVPKSTLINRVLSAYYDRCPLEWITFVNSFNKSITFHMQDEEAFELMDEWVVANMPAWFCTLFTSARLTGEGWVAE